MLCYPLDEATLRKTKRDNSDAGRRLPIVCGVTGQCIWESFKQLMKLQFHSMLQDYCGSCVQTEAKGVYLKQRRFSWRLFDARVDHEENSLDTHNPPHAL